MLSTATALIQATEEAIFADEAMDFARMITHTRSEMNDDQFAKAIFIYSGIIASNAMDKATKVLLTETQFRQLIETIDEMETLRNEVLENGK